MSIVAVYVGITRFYAVFSAYFQRRYAFEADDFAATITQPSALISGLVKLYRENASTLTPDPLYSALHYSPPPAAIRLELRFQCKF